jgi:hypothetical protein
MVQKVPWILNTSRGEVGFAILPKYRQSERGNS